MNIDHFLPTLSLRSSISNFFIFANVSKNVLYSFNDNDFLVLFFVLFRMIYEQLKYE